jgi:hypothetical protein
VSLTDAQKIALEIQNGIRKVEDEVVKQIQDALDKKDTYGELEEAQFRNLVRVAESTESAEVVMNFLRYQVGRERKWGRGSNSLANRIIEDIKKLRYSQAQQIANAAGADDIADIHMRLVRRYLGYGARYLKYLNDGQ